MFARMMRMKHTVLVTGSSRGIGAGIARRFAREGHRVAIHYREREAEARALYTELAEAGCSVMLVSGDITNEAQAGEIVYRVRERFGFVDVLVNNAGIALPTQLVTDTTLSDWHRVMDTNVTGMFLVTNAVLPEMVSNEISFRAWLPARCCSSARTAPISSTASPAVRARSSQERKRTTAAPSRTCAIRAPLISVAFLMRLKYEL